MFRTNYWIPFVTPGGNGGWLRLIRKASIENYDSELEMLIALMDAEHYLKRKFGRDFNVNEEQVIVT